MKTFLLLLIIILTSIFFQFRLFATTIDPRIVSSVTNGNVTTTTYKNGVVSTITQDLQGTKAYITLKKNSITVTGISGVISTSNGIRTVQLLYKNQVFLSYQINNQNKIANVFISSIVYPYSAFSPDNVSYLNCMRSMISGCSQSWACGIICGVNIWSCSTGWSLTCVAMSLQ